MTRPLALRALLGLAATGAGLVTGVAAVLLHQRGWWVVVGLLASLLVVWWLPSRTPRLGWSLAFAGAVLGGSVTRPEGDYLVPGDLAGWSLLVGALVCLMVSAALPDAPGDPGHVGSPT